MHAKVHVDGTGFARAVQGGHDIGAQAMERQLKEPTMESIDNMRGAQVTSEDSTSALVIYILYLAGYLTGFTAAAGLIMAYVQSGTSGGYLESHYRFQIRTFWIGLLYLVVGCILSLVLVGWLVLAWWCVWSLVRILRGMIQLNNRQPIRSPMSWGFGG
jgi:uncharacterized membrane protein